EDVFARRDPERFAARHLTQQLGTLAYDGLEFLERDLPVAIGVGGAEEHGSDAVGRLRLGRSDVLFGEADRNHAEEILLAERTIAVVIVESECERELVPIGAEDELAHAAKELFAPDRAVAIVVHADEHTLREVFAAQAEGF